MSVVFFISADRFDLRAENIPELYTRGNLYCKHAINARNFKLLWLKLSLIGALGSTFNVLHCPLCNVSIS